MTGGFSQKNGLAAGGPLFVLSDMLVVTDEGGTTNQN
jgi:hypothetical protein